MNLKSLILKKFLPFAVLFVLLSVLSLNSSVQKMYYPLFSNASVSVLNSWIGDTYFKDKPKTAQTDFDYNKIGVLFQAKRKLTAIYEAARRQNVQAQYDYKGFNVTIDETFIAPLTFFLCLLLFSPGTWKQKAIALTVGSLLIFGFALLIVYFKGLLMVSRSGVRELAYSQNDLNFFELLHFFFSPVTIVSMVLVTWILVAFRKSDLKRMFDY